MRERRGVLTFAAHGEGRVAVWVDHFKVVATWDLAVIWGIVNRDLDSLDGTTYAVGSSHMFDCGHFDDNSVFGIHLRLVSSDSHCGSVLVIGDVRIGQ